MFFFSFKRTLILVGLKGSHHKKKTFYNHVSWRILTRHCGDHFKMHLIELIVLHTWNQYSVWQLCLNLKKKKRRERKISFCNIRLKYVVFHFLHELNEGLLNGGTVKYEMWRNTFLVSTSPKENRYPHAHYARQVALNSKPYMHRDAKEKAIRDPSNDISI